jgi:hypothetical protein
MIGKKGIRLVSHQFRQTSARDNQSDTFAKRIDTHFRVSIFLPFTNLVEVDVFRTPAELPFETLVELDVKAAPGIPSM